MNLSKSIIKEEINKNIVRIRTESVSTQVTEQGVKVKGLALPFNKISRNGFTYTTESIRETYRSLQGAPVLFNHDPEKVIGHVESVSLGKEGMEYVIDIDPEEKDKVRKLSRQDLKHVSIQCIYDPEKSFISEDDGITHAHISEFLELSVVSLPGFADTTAQVVESFKTKGDNMSKENDKEKKPEEEEEEDEKKQEESEEEDPMKKIESRIDAIEKKYEELCKKMEQEPEEDKEEVDEEEEEKKREEAIKQNKQSISAETILQRKEVTGEEIKKVFMED